MRTKFETLCFLHDVSSGHWLVNYCCRTAWAKGVVGGDGSNDDERGDGVSEMNPIWLPIFFHGDSSTQDRGER